jgi:hypothetical protein
MANRLYFMLLFFITLLVGCDKNDTQFFEDTEKNGLGIFSNKGNNILSAYVNGIAWKTKDRITDGYTNRTDYEIIIEKQKTNTQKDTIIFTWNSTNDNNLNYNTIILRIAVDSSFTYKDFRTNFNGKRLVIDSSVNGYFTTNINTQIMNRNIRGNGVIFFQTAEIDINTTQINSNKMAGLLSAKIGNNVITDGRFDHALNGLPINF